MSSIKNIGKYLDQPILVGKFAKAVPTVLTGCATAIGGINVYKAPEEEKYRTSVHSAIVLASTFVSALVAPKISAKLVGATYEKVDIKKIVKKNEELIKTFLEKNKISDEAKTLLDKGKDNILKPKEIKILTSELNKTKSGEKFLKEFIPEPENITSKDIIKDMGRLSIMGAIPVIGGILGGTLADRITDKEHWKKKFPNKVKEGVYQYLANIFLCNVGAAGALGIMEACKIKSKAARALAMVSGIILTGVVGGSFLANTISKKLIEKPLNKKFDVQEENSRSRKPEILDICLHTDDIATIAVMSGFKWIEPALPMLYAISGYRAAIGYRNKDS